MPQNYTVLITFGYFQAFLDLNEGLGIQQSQPLGVRLIREAPTKFPFGQKGGKYKIYKKKAIGDT